MPSRTVNPTSPTDTPSGLSNASGIVATVHDNGTLSIIAPFLGAVVGSSGAGVGVLEVEQVIYAGIDAVMAVNLPEADAVALLNSFSVIERNGDPFVSKDYAGDVIPAVDVSFNAAGEFTAVMRKVLRDSNEISPAGHTSVTTYFNEQMRLELNAVLSSTGLLDMLEASNVNGVTVVLDVSEGAIDMTGKIAGTVGTPTYTATVPTRRRLFATQIPLATWAKYLKLGTVTIENGVPSLAPDYSEEGRTQLDFLPLKGGDSITFVFDIDVTAPSSLTPNSSATSAIDGITIEKIDAFGAIKLNVALANVTRRVAFKVTLDPATGVSTGNPYAPNFTAAGTAAKAAEFDISGNATANEAAAWRALVAQPFSLQLKADAVTGAAAVVPDATNMDAAGELAGATWMLGAGVADANARFNAEAQAVALTQITEDLSGAVASAITDVSDAIVDLATEEAQLGVPYTAEMKVTDVSNAIIALATAITDVSDALIVQQDAEWARINGLGDGAVTGSLATFISPPNHPDPVSLLTVLEADLETARVALAEAIDASGASYDSTLLDAFNDASLAVAEKKYAQAHLSALTAAANAAATAYNTATTAKNTASDAIPIAQAKALGPATSDVTDVSNAIIALATAQAALAGKQAAYAAALALSGPAVTAYEGSVGALTLFNTGYDAAVAMGIDAWKAAEKARAVDKVIKEAYAAYITLVTPSAPA
jgi:hypothetical protein